MARRAGWLGVLALVVLAALVGLLGGGPLSQAVAGGEGSPLQVQYGRFVRHRAPTDMEIQLIITLIGADIVMQVIGRRWQKADKLLNDVPLVLVEDGQVLQDRLKKSRVTEDDILEQARTLRGVERLDQIKYAVLERSGGISIIPKQVAWATSEEDRKAMAEASS